jgi:hypothetical protein
MIETKRKHVTNMIFSHVGSFVPLDSKLYYDETHMIEFKRKHVMSIIINHVRFHPTIEIKIIYG